MRLAVAIMVLCLAGCVGPFGGHGHGAHGPGASMGGGGGIVADTYVAGLEQVGEDGIFSVRLVESDPIPRDTGIYTWTIEVVDATGGPVTGVTVLAEPMMPAHGHGTIPKFIDGIPSEGEGRYRLADMDLFMPGIWRVIITLTHDDGREDVALYHFDLEG